MRILSLFDGIGCAQLALKKANVLYDAYYASEIDKYALIISKKNHPKTIQLGDVRAITSLDDVDLLIGGSPCQGLSLGHKGLGLADNRSVLFYEYARLLNTLKPKYFLLENTRMTKDNKNIISGELGVEPIEINSALVSAQNRNRLYWTNLPLGKINNKNITFGCIREYNATNVKYYNDTNLRYIENVQAKGSKKFRIIDDNDKTPTIVASMSHGLSEHRFYGVNDSKGLRFLTPLECERAQTIPDNYTFGVSNTQRYKMIGNAFTVDIIAKFLESLI